MEAIRYVQSAEIVSALTDRSAIPVDLSDPKLKQFPGSGPIDAKSTGRKKVIVTGCYDWLHTGHVRFFEEVFQNMEMCTQWWATMPTIEIAERQRASAV